MVPIFLLFLVVCATGLSEIQKLNLIVGPSNMLGAALYNQLCAGDENVFFSPLSISTALEMLFYGTRGKTAEEMKIALGYQDAGLTGNQVHLAFRNLLETFGKNSTNKEYSLYLANAVLVQKGYDILDKYKRGLQEIYEATARSVDFQSVPERAVREINEWVREKTNNQISKPFNQLDLDTVMVILNAIYFKGTWKTKFKRAKEGIFFNRGLETQRVKAQMMYYVKDVLYTRGRDYQAIELPYKGDDVSMVILLPDAMDGLTQLEKELTHNTITEIRKSLRKISVHVRLPKFKLEYEKILNTVLQHLGVKSIFERSADLSGISETGRLAVSKIVHKAVVEVNEEGTEASSVTGVVVRPVSVSLDIRFEANHPFFFTIVDRRRDLILFQGRVNKL